MYRNLDLKSENARLREENRQLRGVDSVVREGCRQRCRAYCARTIFLATLLSIIYLLLGGATFSYRCSQATAESCQHNMQLMACRWSAPRAHDVLAVAFWPVYWPLEAGRAAGAVDDDRQEDLKWE